MNFFFIHPFKMRRDPANVPPHRAPIHDQSEGSEFLDDAIHWEDVQETPVSYSEEIKNTNDRGHSTF
jgi:hypothetical protein